MKHYNALHHIKDKAYPEFLERISKDDRFMLLMVKMFA